MATTADFRGLDWLIHELTLRDDVSTYQKVECVWTSFPGAPYGLVVHELSAHALACEKTRDNTHASVDQVVRDYLAWSQPAPRASDPDVVRGMGLAMQHPTSFSVRLGPSPDTREALAGAPGPAEPPRSALTRLLDAVHGLLDNEDLDERLVELSHAVDAFEAEQHEASETIRMHEQGDAYRHSVTG